MIYNIKIAMDKIENAHFQHTLDRCFFLSFIFFEHSVMAAHKLNVSFDLVGRYLSHIVNNSDKSFKS